MNSNLIVLQNLLIFFLGLTFLLSEGQYTAYFGPKVIIMGH